MISVSASAALVSVVFRDLEGIVQAGEQEPDV